MALKSVKTFTENEFKAKALSLTSNATNGLMNDTQMDEFFRLTIDESSLKNISRVMQVQNRQGEINRVGMSGRVAQLKYSSDGPVDAEGLDKDAITNTTGVRSNASFSKVQYTTHGIVALIEMSDDFMDFTIEGQGVVETVVNQVNSQLMNDVEEFLLLSDTAETDEFLYQFNGWKKRIQTSGHVVDAAGAAFNTQLVSRALRAIPTKWRRNKAAMRLLVSPNTAQTYVDGLTTRETGLGDQTLQGFMPRPYGIPMVEVPLIPVDLPVTVGSSSYNEGSFALLTDPQNLLTIVAREVAVERDRNIAAQTDIFAIHMRIGSCVMLEDAATVITNLRENPDV